MKSTAWPSNSHTRVPTKPR